MAGVYGLSGSGMDIDDLVKGMMKTQQAKYDKLYKQKTVQAMKKEQYSTLYKSIYNFRYNTLSDFKMQSTMSAKKALSTNDSVVTAKALGDAVTMTHDVTVKQLASNAYLQSAQGITRGNAAAREETVTNAEAAYIDKKAQAEYDTAYQAAIAAQPDDEDAAKLAGDTAKQNYLDNLTEDSDDYKAAVEAGKAAGVKFDESINKSVKLSDIAGISRPAGAEDSDIALAFKIDDGSNEAKYVKYTYADIESGKTLNDLVSDVNKLGGNIQSSYDNNNDSFSLYNKNGGESNKIELSLVSEFTETDASGKQVTYQVSDEAKAKTANFVNNLHLAQYDADNKELGAEKKFAKAGTTGEYNTVSEVGVSAKAIIDGKEYSSDSNSLTAGSVVYTLNKVSDKTPKTDDSGNVIKDADGNIVYNYDSTKVTINSDDDAIVNNVKKFVDEYNKMLDEINSLIYEEYDSNYLPLTDDEKADMTEDQIKKWEEKAKTGLLAKDPILKDAVNQMRSAMSSILTGTGNDYNSLSSIGITTTDYTEHGKIQLDEDALRKALDSDPDSVYKLFSNLSDESSERGIVHKISDVLNDTLSKIKSQAGTTADDNDQSYVGLKIGRLTTQMTTLKSRMDKQQSMLYKKFNAMETAISQLNQQYSYISSAFGSSS